MKRPGIVNDGGKARFVELERLVKPGGIRRLSIEKVVCGVS